MSIETIIDIVNSYKKLIFEFLERSIKSTLKRFQYSMPVFDPVFAAFLVLIQDSFWVNTRNRMFQLLNQLSVVGVVICDTNLEKINLLMTSTDDRVRRSQNCVELVRLCDIIQPMILNISFTGEVVSLRTMALCVARQQFLAGHQ